MALRFAMMKDMKRMMQQTLVQTRGVRTSAGPNMKAYASTVEGEGVHMPMAQRPRILEQMVPKGKAKADYVPVYVALGMISLAVALGLHTVKQHLAYDPEVHLKKSRRETIPEVVEPEVVVKEAENLMKKSFFRKVAHIQDFEKPMSDPIHGNPLVKEPKYETLKSVGVDPVEGGKLHR